jgi:hypothetical protein
MTERTVSVSLRMKVRDYVMGGSEAIAMNRRLQASQRELAGEADKTAEALTKSGNAAEMSGRKMGKGLLYGAAGLAALGAAGGGIKLLPPLLAATATGAAVLPQILLGSAAAGGVLKLALSGVGDEFKAVQKAQDQFGKSSAPNAQALVAQYAALRPVLQGVQQGFQQKALAGTAQGLDLLVSKTLPQVSGGLNALADDWSHFFAEVALTASSPEMVGAFNTVTASADEFFDQFNNRIRPLGKSIATLITSADPVAQAFGGRLMAMLDRFNAAVERGRQSGSLAAIFESGAAAAAELMSISEDVLRITGMVIKEAAATNEASGSAAATLRAYVESGRAASDVAGIVHTLTLAWEGLAAVMGPIGELARDALADPGLAASVAQLFGVMAIGSEVLTTVLRVLLALNDATGGVLLALVGLALAASKLNVAIALTSAAAAKGAASLATYGAAGAAAGRGLSVAAVGAGKLVGALLALEAAHQIFKAFSDDSANVDKLDASIKRMAESGVAAGEVTRVFNQGWGDMNLQAEFANADGWFSGFLRDAEEAIPITGDLARMLGSPSFVQSSENFAALDASMTKYAQTTNDVQGTTDAWNAVMKESGLDQVELQKLLPATAAELTRLQTEAHNAETGMGRLAERTALLNAPLKEAITLGRGLLDVFNELNGGSINFAKAQIAAEEAVDKLAEGLDKSGLALNRQKDGFNINNEKGRQNLALTLGLAEAAAKAAQARMDEGGTIQEAAGIYDGYINRLRATLAAQGATPGQIEAIIGKYTQMPASLEAAGAAVNDLNSKLAAIPKGTKFTFDGKSMIDGQGRALDLGQELKGLPKGQTFTWNGKNLVDGRGKVIDLQKAIQTLPGSKATKITTPGIDPATGKVRGLADELQGMPDGIASIRVNNGGALQAIREVRQSLANLGGGGVVNMRGGAYLPRQRGGVRVAAEGLLEPQIAPPGTRYQWAEPETGGELFLPRRGINRKRGRALLGVAANWYGGEFVPTTPMAAGGYRAAAAGLVNMAPRDTSSSGTTTRATRLDYAESYLRARDAVASLSKSLKENGRSFSVSTAKGRENRSAVISGIRAAQDAAKTKYEETGSVTAANKAYAEHIARLKATLQQRKVNAATIKSLLSMAGRPEYDIPKGTPTAPTNSLSNIAYAKAAIGVAGGLEDLRDKLSLNKAGVDLRTDFGRENLGNIIGFFEEAARAAQARFEQTRSAATATALYNQHVADLRKILASSGYSAATINSLVNSYGRITLTPNERGGVYMAAGGMASLRRAGIFPAGSTPMYGFAEPGTGGELFVPRFGEQQRGRDLLDIAAGWYGGRFTAGGGGDGASSYDYSTHLTVQPQTYNPSPAELAGHQRELDARARVGRPR